MISLFVVLAFWVLLSFLLYKWQIFLNYEWFNRLRRNLGYHLHRRNFGRCCLIFNLLLFLMLLVMHLVTFLFVSLIFLILIITYILNVCIVLLKALLVLCILWFLIILLIVQSLDFFMWGLEVFDEVIHHFLFIHLLLFSVPSFFRVLTIF